MTIEKIKEVALNQEQILQIARNIGIIVSRSHYKNMYWDVLTFNEANLLAFVNAIKEAFTKELTGEQEPCGYSVTGPYEDNLFKDKSSASAFQSGLNKGYGENAYTIEPLYTIPPSQADRIKELEDALTMLTTAKEYKDSQGKDDIYESMRTRAWDFAYKTLRKSR